MEAGILPMPSASEWAESLDKLGMGSKDGMVACSLVGEGCKKQELCAAFESLDQALQSELQEEENLKEAMGYNMIMLEHALCKIKRIGADLF